jgi:hypothetical protein
MYYEVFEEIRKGSFSHQELINKCVIDSIYRPKSQIQDIYNSVQDHKSLLENSYPYIIYQKVLMGISTAVFFGMDPYSWNEGFFLENCRIKVPKNPLNLYMTWPSLIFESGDTLSFKKSSLAKWDIELRKISSSIQKITGVTITEEGFRAHTYRILENLMSLQAQSPKRTRWAEFLHEILIIDKTFTLSELKEKFTISNLEDGRILVEDREFISKDYLEFNFMKKIGHLNTQIMTQELKTEEDAFGLFSKVNDLIMGKIPLSHFYIGQHMFVGKEEFNLNNYYDYYIKTWGINNELTVHYLNNPTGERESCSIEEFPKKLKQSEYIIVLGVTEKSRGTVDAQPRMLKG